VEVDGRDVLVQSLWIGGTVADIAGREFAVFGITGGDIGQTTSRQIREHATWHARAGDAEWSLGAPAVVFGPPAKPVGLAAEVDGHDVVLSWSSVRGATDYYVHVYRFGETELLETVRVGADPSACRVQARISGLVARLTHVFRVEAERAGVPMRGELSDPVTARVGGGRSPQASDRAAGTGGGSGSCTVPVEVDPFVEVTGVCPEDGYSWSLRAAGGGFECDRVDSAGTSPGERVVSCPSVEPPYVVVRVGGVAKCRRTLSAPPSESLGPPECEEGFLPSGGGASCSRTDRVPATATTVYSCEDGYTLVNLGTPFCSKDETEPATATVSYVCDGGGVFVPGAVGGGHCRILVAAKATTTYSCRSGYSLVRFFVSPGVTGRRCERPVPAKATTTYSCSAGYRLVTVPLGGRYCRKLVAADAATTYSCRSGYSLVRFFVSPGVAGRRCERSLPAKATTTYSCSAGYRLVRIPLGGQYCRKSTPATATYVCPGGYTRSGATCSKYAYKDLTGARCPAGYTVVFNGLVFLCRKRVTTPATVTYSCASGRLSGTDCVLTATPTATVTYSCAAGRLSGAECVLTATPKSTTSYSCTKGTLSDTDCVLTASPRSKTAYSCDSGALSGTRCVITAPPKATVTYDCDDAPPGYTLSGTDCVKTTTGQPARPTVYTCRGGYDRNEPPGGAGPPTCTKTDTVDATVTITPASCPAVPRGEPEYRLVTERVATATRRACIRTVTADATVTRTYMCPRNYRLETTTAGGDTDHTCRRDKPAA